MSIGGNIKKYRMELNLTQNELAEISGVPQPTISQYERNLFIPTITSAWLIADALHISVDQLRPAYETNNNPEVQ